MATLDHLVKVKKSCTKLRPFTIPSLIPLAVLANTGPVAFVCTVVAACINAKQVKMSPSLRKKTEDPK